jgi:acyl transferase domain-containing protein
VLKAIAMLERGMILPNANFETPNPDIDFTGLRLKVKSLYCLTTRPSGD